MRLPNGNSLVLVYRPRDGVDLSAHGGPANATVLDAEVQEIAPDGSVAWSWNSAGRIGIDEVQRWWDYILANPVHLEDGRTAYDVAHPNSIEPDGDGLIISLRHINARAADRQGHGQHHLEARRHHDLEVAVHRRATRWAPRASAASTMLAS